MKLRIKDLLHILRKSSKLNILHGSHSMYEIYTLIIRAFISVFRKRVVMGLKVCIPRHIPPITYALNDAI